MLRSCLPHLVGSIQVDIADDRIAGIAVDLDLILTAEGVFKLNLIYIDRIKDAAHITQMAVGVVHIKAGCALCFDRLINVSGDSALCFRPLVPEVRAQGTLIWKRYQVLSPAVRLFIEQLR